MLQFAAHGKILLPIWLLASQELIEKDEQTWQSGWPLGNWGVASR